MNWKRLYLKRWTLPGVQRLQSRMSLGRGYGQTKVRIFNHYYTHHREKPPITCLATSISSQGWPAVRICVSTGLFNFPPVSMGIKQIMGIAQDRQLPSFYKPARIQAMDKKHEKPGGQTERVLVLGDAFTAYMVPESGLAAINVLKRAGCIRSCSVLKAQAGHCFPKDFWLQLAGMRSVLSRRCTRWIQKERRPL